MRKIDTIIVHCSASVQGVDLHAKDIDRMHREQNGWKKIGYHFVVTTDGEIESGRDIDEIGSHTKGYNERSIGICYIGGLDKEGNAKDTRTIKQKIAMFSLIRKLCDEYSIKKIIGHRDISPDLNKNGVIEPFERIKECPCFNAIEEYGRILKKT